MGERIRNDFAIFTSKAIWAASKGSFAKEKSCFLKILKKKKKNQTQKTLYMSIVEKLHPQMTRAILGSGDFSLLIRLPHYVSLDWQWLMPPGSSSI